MWENTGNDVGGPSVDIGIMKLWRAKDGFLYAAGEIYAMYRYGVSDYTELNGLVRYDGNRWHRVDTGIVGHFINDHVFTDHDDVAWFTANAAVPYTLDKPWGETAMFGVKNGVIYPNFMTSISKGYPRIKKSVSFSSGAALYLTDYPDRVFPTPDLLFPAVNVVENYGDADTPLALFIDSAHVPVFIRNENLSTVAFSPELVIEDDEVFIIRSDSFRPMTYSTFRNELSSKLIGGFSNVRDIKLHSGSNRISIFVTNPDATAWCVWRNRYWGISASFGRE